MAVDLTGLTPYREFSRKTLAAAYPGGQAAVDDKALEAEINKQLWGTGGSAGIYGQMARRGLSELQPETQYATSRVVKESMQDLLNQYQNRQIAAMNAARTAELTEPTFRLSEAGLTGEYGGAPTLAREQMDIDRMLREAGLTGTYKGDPTEARLARQATEALQAGQLTGTYGGAPTLAARQLEQQESQFGRQLGSTERLAQLQRELQLEMAKGGWASTERIAQLNAEIQREKLTLDQAKALGSIGGTPTLENVLGERKLDIFQSAIKAAEQQARNKMYSDLLAGLAMRSGLLGTGVGAAGTGVIDRLLQGTIGKAGNAVVDAILGAIGGGTAAWPTFTSLGLENPALGPLSEADWMIDATGNIVPLSGSPTPTALGPAGLPPALPGAEALDFGPVLSATPATGAGFLTPGGVGAAAPSIEAGLVEMLGPELAAQLGYSVGPAAVEAGLIGANVGAGLTPAAVEAMTGLSTGAGTGMTVGSGAGLLGPLGTMGLMAMPALIPLIGRLFDPDNTASVEAEVAQGLYSNPTELAAVLERLRNLRFHGEGVTGLGMGYGLEFQASLLPNTQVSDSLVMRILSQLGHGDAVQAAMARIGPAMRAYDAQRQALLDSYGGH